MSNSESDAKSIDEVLSKAFGINRQNGNGVLNDGFSNAHVIQR